MSNFCLELPTPFCCPVRIRAPCVSVLSTACAVTSPVCFRVQVFCFSLSLQGAPACISEAAALPPCVSGFYTHHALHIPTFTYMHTVRLMLVPNQQSVLQFLHRTNAPLVLQHWESLTQPSSAMEIPPLKQHWDCPWHCKASCSNISSIRCSSFVEHHHSHYFRIKAQASKWTSTLQ